MVIRITSRYSGFRRCGIEHLDTPVDYPRSRFTPEQIATLRAEPALTVEEISPSPNPDAVEDTPPAPNPDAVEGTLPAPHVDVAKDAPPAHATPPTGEGEPKRTTASKKPKAGTAKAAGREKKGN